MDAVDKKLVELLQKNARTPLKVLAEKVFLSSPAVSARIAKLEKEGILKGYHADVDPLKVGYHIMAFINLEMEPVRKPEFYQFAKECRSVLECHCITGQYTILLKVAFPSTMELDVFIGRLQQFGKTSTSIVFSTEVETRGVDVGSEQD